MFLWIKRGLPRGLYARAALIVLIPIITIQCLVSAAIVQRYFERLVQQMTQGAAHEIILVLDTLSDAPDQAAHMAAMLDIAIAAPNIQADRRAFDDLTGGQVTRVLYDILPNVMAVDLETYDRKAAIVFEHDTGQVMILVPRSRLSPTNPHQVIVLTILIGFIMAGVAYLFLRNQLRPIRRLATAAEAFGKGRVIPYNPSGATEVRSAGRAFLDMRARIENMIEQRILMLSGVSHDLRTPLTRMKLNLSMMDPTPEVTDLTRDVNEMENLLTTFLDFARGDMLDDPAPVDPVALAKDLAVDIKRMGRDLKIIAPQITTMVELRPQAVQRALSNLVSNALRYGTQARLSVHLPERAVRFIIEDNGPGIPASERDRALQPFSRLDDARNQDHGTNVGLGLAIANDIAIRHGGSLTLDRSVSMGGLRIDLVFPR
jgi:two-component system osmolarity sensor histidine kinase EnvZ